MPLVDTKVKAAKARLSDYTLADGNGLYLRVRRTGAKTWITRRMIAGKVHVQTIGAYPDTTLLEARDIAAGKALEQRAADKRTVRSLGEQYALRVLERNYKDSRPVVRYLDRDIYPLIGSKRVGDVAASDIDRLLQAKLEDGIYATNMLLMLLKGMFGFAVRTGWAKSNPAASFARKDAGGKQAPRQRVLTDDELRAMWSTPTMHVGAIRLAILTGCRISEACGALWTQIDLKRKRWTLPASATKQKTRPLVSPVAACDRIARGAAAHRRPRLSWRRSQGRRERAVSDENARPGCRPRLHAARRPSDDGDAPGRARR